MPAPAAPPPPRSSAGPASRDRSTLFGVLGIVLGLCCCGPLGVVFGILSIQQAKRHRRPLVPGYAAIVVGALNLAVNIALVATHNFPGT